MASTDYTGRTVDLLIFQGVTDTGEVGVDLGFGTSGYICTGAQKAVQTFLSFLLSTAGSVVHDPDFGSSFWTKIKFNQIHSDIDFVIEFNFAVNDFMNYQEINYKDIPDDEYITEIKLVSFNIQRGSVLINASVTTLAGTSREVILPISLAIK